MARELREIKHQIGQKNLILSTIRGQELTDKERIRNLETELDGLLYQYYKLLKCS